MTAVSSLIIDVARLVAISMGVLKLDGSGLPEVRLIYIYAKLRAPSLIRLSKGQASRQPCFVAF